MTPTLKTYLLPLIPVLLLGLASPFIIPVLAQNDFTCEQDSIEDIDGNRYSTLEFGNQCWLGENLKTTTYRDGTDIPTIPDHNKWWADTEGAYALYDHTFPFRYVAREITSDQEMLEVFGYLYNFYAVDNPHGLCPDGWKVPTDNDWKELESYLGMPAAEVNKNWYRGSTEGSQLAGQSELWDEDGIKHEEFARSGFDARPAGYRRSYGDYGNLNANANFWTADEATTRKPSDQTGKNAVSREIYAGNSVIYRITNINKNNGHSVRCLKE